MMHLTQNRATTGKLLALALLLAAIVASLMLAAKPAHASTTFTVNSTADHADQNLDIGSCDTGYDVPGAGGVMEPECTLRAAIEQANYTPGPDTINFAIPGTGVHAIVPVTQLPTITGPVTINGYSQPGAQPNQKAVGSDAVLKIELNGAEAMGTEGLKIEASNSTVKGLVINNWHYAGVRIDGSGATGNRIRGNYIGTDASGTKDLGNSSDGVGIEDGSGSTVGGATAAERNVISGNKGNGIGIYGGGNRIAGNYVGTDKNGTAPLGNAVGVDIHEASNNYVGAQRPAHATSSPPASTTA